MHVCEAPHSLISSLQLMIKMVQVAGIFEKFTEKAIKAVMLAQNFAQKMGASEVCHLLTDPP